MPFKLITYEWYTSVKDQLTFRSDVLAVISLLKKLLIGDIRNSYNTGMSALPNIYTQCLRACSA